MPSYYTDFYLACPLFRCFHRLCRLQI